MIRRLITTRDAVLMLLTLSSGVVDAVSFIAFGKVFTAFMTGNLVFLGLGATHAFLPNGPNVERVCIVLVAFSLGVFLAARLTKRVRRSRALDDALPITLAVIVVIQLGFLVGWVAVSGHPSVASATLLAAIEAVAMGMQSSAVGALDVKGVFTTAATATLINLSREAADRSVSDTDPARMARILVSLIAGATIGGLLLVHARPYAAVVSPLVTALALGATVAGRRAAARDVPGAAAVTLAPTPVAGDAEAA
jgi:uncharacterized membrane protein YoaK (UPF0700 family)